MNHHPEHQDPEGKAQVHGPLHNDLGVEGVVELGHVPVHPPGAQAQLGRDLVPQLPLQGRLQGARPRDRAVPEAGRLHFPALDLRPP